MANNSIRTKDSRKGKTAKYIVYSISFCFSFALSLYLISYLNNKILDNKIDKDVGIIVNVDNVEQTLIVEYELTEMDSLLPSLGKGKQYVLVTSPQGKDILGEQKVGSTYKVKNRQNTMILDSFTQEN